jgi:hypothetical protein
LSIVWQQNELLNEFNIPKRKKSVKWFFLFLFNYEFSTARTVLAQ